MRRNRRITCRMTCILLLFLTLAACASADTDALSWTLEMAGNGHTVPEVMVTAVRSGVFIAGYTSSTGGDFGLSHGGRDGFILRVNALGNTLWYARLGGSANDRFTALLETDDGGCIALGETLSMDGAASASRGGKDAWLVRLDRSGELLWTKTLGGSLDDELYDLLPAGEDRYLLCGRTQSRNGDLGANYGGWDAWALLIDGANGQPLWTYRYGFAGDDMFAHAFQTASGGWLLMGEAAEELPGSPDDDEPLYLGRPIVQRLDASGEAVWDVPRVLGDTGVNRLLEIVQTDTGWLLAGETNSRSSLMPPPQGGMDIWVLHMRESGTVSWQRTYGSTRDERLSALHKPPAGVGYVLLGETDSMGGQDGQVYGAHGESDVWVVRISQTGVIDWQQPIGGSGDSTVAGLLHTEDGGFLVAGTTASQDGDIGRHASQQTAFITRLAENGNLLDTSLLAPDKDCTLAALAARNGIGYVLGTFQETQAGHNVETLWLARLSEEGLIDQ